MNIYLIRHGDAEKAYAVKSDFDRQLTPDGKNQLRTAANSWKLFIKNFDYIISSPLVRAVQTAEIVKDVFEHKNELIIDEKIASGGSTEELIEVANSIGGDDMAFIGHEPDFSNHVSNLVSNSGARVDFKKGMIAKISFNNRVRLSKGTLEFLIPPKVFK